MIKSRYSTNILAVELCHLVIGIGFGLVPWGWTAGTLFVLWKVLRHDPKRNYGEFGFGWLWLVPPTYLGHDGQVRWSEYRWGPGPAGGIGFARKAWMDMVFYFAGMALGIWWQPW